MESLRKPFQGVTNIIRFNWHFYVMSVGLVLLLLLSNIYLNSQFRFYSNVLCILVVIPTVVSLLVSAYVYDFSNLYKLDWLHNLGIEPGGTHVNINAGFDETSFLLASKYPDSTLVVYDFYDAAKHTEVSIERARKAYPPYAGTIKISTASLLLSENAVDTIFLIFAAHEIRNDEERVVFLKELRRCLKPSGKIIVTEHLRDWPNFLAYNIGFFHFLSRDSWLKTFANAGLGLVAENKITPFISTFILTKNGTTH
jgi:ubiquinone/menaquinone biosynthesis C-methylase UbiE